MTDAMIEAADRNCLSFWFPILERAGLPVPRTRVIRVDTDLTPLLDGDMSILPAVMALHKEIDAGARELGGYPVFLRTGHGSGKHDWRHSCYLGAREEIASHVAALVEWSHLVDLMGFPTDVWAVRELLPTVPFATVFAGMPVCREFRCFVDDGEVAYVHPYWPREALREGSPDELPPWVYEDLCALEPADRQTVTDLAAHAGHVLGGRWSIDVLDTRNGWFITDVAEAERSFHWPDCEVRAC